jgi:hypothetical protein
VVDGFSHYVWIHFLTSKTETNKIIKTLFNQIEAASGKKIAHLVSDNGTEFKNKDLIAFYDETGIKHLPTAPYMPENNPFAERGNQTTVNKARCLLKPSGLSQRYWAEACNTTVYLENRTICKSIDFLTPFELWLQKPPKLNRLFPFGCQAIFLKNRASGKFGDRGAAGTFLGYGEGNRTYRIEHGETGTVQTTHHAKFHKHTFPAKILSTPVSTKADPILFTISLDEQSDAEVSGNTQTSEAIPNPQPPSEANPDSPNTTSDLDFFDSTSLIPITDDLNTIYQNVVTQPIRDSPIHEIIGDVCKRNVLPGRLRPRHEANLVSYIQNDPKTHFQAIRSPDKDLWKGAISTEPGNMDCHHVWTPVERNISIHPLTTTWVFKRKTDENGDLSKYKARLCVRGFHQREGVDYNDVFSPTGRLTSL